MHPCFGKNTSKLHSWFKDTTASHNPAITNVEDPMVVPLHVVQVSSSSLTGAVPLSITSQSETGGGGGGGGGGGENKRGRG